jgi:hypothetical protein
VYCVVSSWRSKSSDVEEKRSRKMRVPEKKEKSCVFCVESKMKMERIFSFSRRRCRLLVALLRVLHDSFFTMLFISRSKGPNLVDKKRKTLSWHN